ncbi:phage terminase small subunit P27 family [Bradyrhizobium sp. 159]|nr:phage terminase small subunit P27 family [Bradyrhizobium sp. 159]
MIMRGRKPTPTHLKLLNGNPGKRPINLREPGPELRAPTCPAHLCPAAKAEWKRLAAQLIVLRMLTDLDRGALAAYCQAYGRWVEAERKLHETPMLLKLPSGIVQQNPWLTIANKQLELMHKYLTEFGLSPVSRSRVSVAPAAPGRSKFEGLLGRQPDEFFDD